MGLHWECQTTEAPDMAREFRVIDGEIWLATVALCGFARTSPTPPRTMRLQQLGGFHACDHAFSAAAASTR